MILKGSKGFAAYQTYVTIMAFLPTCDRYNDKQFIANGEISLDAVFEDFKLLDDNDKKLLIVESLKVNILSESQVGNLLCVHKDKNDISISRQSVNNFDIADIMKMILETCLTCSYVDSELFFLTESEFNSLGPRSIDAASFAFTVLEKSPGIETGDLIAMIIRKAYDLKVRLENG